MDEESDPIHENEEFEVVFGKSGKFEVVCSNYLRMKAELIVLDPAISSAELAKLLAKEDQPTLMAHVDGFKYSASISSSTSGPISTQPIPPMHPTTHTTSTTTTTNINITTTPPNSLNANPLMIAQEPAVLPATSSTDSAKNSAKKTNRDDILNGSNRKPPAITAALEDENEEDRKIANDFVLQLKE